MGSILPLHALVIHQTQVGFVHQGAGLERMARALALHIIVRQAAELLINDGRQVVECVLVSIAPRAEQPAYLVCVHLARRCRVVHLYRVIIPPLRSQ